MPHFFGIHVFLNLHELSPPDSKNWSNETGEVPYLTPWFFFEDFQTFAVLHALPICRIEGDDFVPTYTVLGLTYFSEDRNEILRRWRLEVIKHEWDDPDYYPALLELPGLGFQQTFNETLYDLNAWGKEGKLGWLDFLDSALPLMIGPNLELPGPYRNIKGSRNTYVWRNGKKAEF